MVVDIRTAVVGVALVATVAGGAVVDDDVVAAAVVEVTATSDVVVLSAREVDDATLELVVAFGTFVGSADDSLEPALHDATTIVVIPTSAQKMALRRFTDCPPR